MCLNGCGVNGRKGGDKDERGAKNSKQANGTVHTSLSGKPEWVCVTLRDVSSSLGAAHPTLKWANEMSFSDSARGRLEDAV